MLPDCNSGSQIEVNDDGSQIFLLMRKYWPTLVTNNKYFWEHEYNKHGYCYNQKFGLDVNKPELYFQKGLDLFMQYKINTLIIDTFGDHNGDVSFTFSEFLEKLKTAMGGDFFAIKCKSVNGKQYLNEIRFKLDLDFKLTTEGKEGGSCKSKKPVYINYW